MTGKILSISQLGNPILRGIAEPVPDLESGKVQVLIDDMLATLVDSKGVGLAAPQVYEAMRIIIVASRPSRNNPDAPEMPPTAMINPEVVEYSSEIVNGWEGCLSIPGLRGFVPRPAQIRLKYLDRTGQPFEQEFKGFAARIALHEIDHLDGLTYLDRMDSMREIMTEKEFLKMIEGKG